MNSIYNNARYRFATAQLNWITQKLILIAWSGPPNFVETDVRVTDIIARGETTAAGYSLDIITKSVSVEGYLQSDTVVVPTVPVGPDITHFIIASYVSAWDDGFPIIYVDEALNLPFEPNGLDIVVQPDWLEQRGWGRV